MAGYYSDFLPEEVNPVSDKFVTIMQPDHAHTSNFRHAKRRKLNSKFDDCHLLPDGTVTQDMDLLVGLQRQVKHNLWNPDGPLGRRVIARLEASEPKSVTETDLAPIDEEHRQTE
jgi:hypothetical protein